MSLFLVVPGIQAKWSRSNFNAVADLSFHKQASIFFDAFFQEIGGRNGVETIYSKYRYMVNFHVTAEANVRKAARRHSRKNPGTTWWLQRELRELKKYKP